MVAELLAWDLGELKGLSVKEAPVCGGLCASPALLGDCSLFGSFRVSFAALPDLAKCMKYFSGV